MLLHDIEQAESRTAGSFDTAFPIRYEILRNIEVEGKYRLRYMLAEAQIPYLVRL